MNKTYSAADLKFLNLLSEKFPTIADATTEIINLEAILNLPKGTEHFLTDLHGEYEAFRHVLKNASGVIRQKVHEVFNNTLRESEMTELCTLIYYPAEKLQLIKQKESNLDDWYKVTLNQLTEVCRAVSVKYTRSKVRKMLPPDFSYVIQELLHESDSPGSPKQSYFNGILNSIISIGRADAFIIAMSNVIQCLTIDRLHIIGDIFDRGPGPHFIFDTLAQYKMYDIQWGNHDILWMGAAAGNLASIANVIRVSARYDNLDVLEDGYGINMLPLATFALETYGDDPCECFAAKGGEDSGNSQQMLERRMHKAITVMQLKLENRLIRENPEYGMENRRLLEKIDYQNGTVTIGEKTYALRDKSFPTIDPAHPDELTEKEAEVLDKLIFAFRNSEKLQAHVDFLLKKGSLYRVYNGNLLYHGCMPMNEDGTLKEVQVDGKKYKGKALYDILEHNVRRAFVSRDPKKREQGRNTLWYLWTAPNSPLYGRDKMTTFERYFLAEKETWTEVKNAYYRLIEKEETADRILQEFGLAGENVHIINGHVPVHQSAGESPVKCGGKVLIIDGGFCRAYHKETGIAGYTLIYNSYGLSLTAHEPFESTEKAIQEEKDIVSRQVAVRYNMKRQLVGDTDQGRQIRQRIRELKELIEAYRTAQLKELL